MILNILTRQYVPVSKFSETVQFDLGLIGQTAKLTFDYTE